MKKEQKKMIVGIVAVVMAVALVTVAVVTVVMKSRNGNTPSETDSTPTVIEPIHPVVPTEKTDETKPQEEEVLDPTHEEDPEEYPECVIDVCNSEIQPNRKDTPEIVGDVVFLPGVKEENE